MATVKRTTHSRSSRDLPRTIWYMGAKARVIPGFLDRALEQECAPGGTVLDLMSGSGSVSAFAAKRYRVIANDVQEYSAVIARSFIEHDPKSRDELVGALDPDADLGASIEKRLRALEDCWAPALEAEARLFQELPEPRAGRSRGVAKPSSAWLESYRAFVSDPSAIYPVDSTAKGSPFARAAKLLAPDAVERWRRGEGEGAAYLATAYWTNVYYGVKQAITIDAIRSAIDDIPRRDPLREKKRTHYLSALLHAASVSTSGTSHFAQPRHVRKDSELIAVAKRRRIDLLALFHEFSSDIADFVRTTPYEEGNRAISCDWRTLLLPRTSLDEIGSPEVASALPAKPDVIYADPPYTADNYSRFYHVLEVITRYDWPPLLRRADGSISRGRYPESSHRFRSGFCTQRSVETEFRDLVHAAAALDASIIVSYSWPSGLLLRTWSRTHGDKAAIQRLRSLFGEAYGRVTIERLPILHSGQGDSMIPVEELLIIGSKPRGRRRSTPGAAEALAKTGKRRSVGAR